MNYNDDIKGILIKDFNEYRDYVIKNISDHWINSSSADLYNVFGEPKKYPFVFIKLWGDPEPGWGPIKKEHVKVYF